MQSCKDVIQKMLRVGQSILSLSLLVTVCSVSTSGNAIANSTESRSSLKHNFSMESGEVKPAFQETSAAVKQTQNRVKVFFPKSPKSDNDISYVEPVFRTTQRRDLPQFAIEQLIVGPNTNEVKNGFSKALEVRGNSNCGKDFTVSISKGVARLKFCKQVPSGGIGDDARAKSSLEATLKQFPSVKSVIILTKEGDCLGDMSGENFCLRSR